MFRLPRLQPAGGATQQCSICITAACPYSSFLHRQSVLPASTMGCCRGAAAWPLRLPALSTRTPRPLRPGASADLWSRRNLKVQAAGGHEGKLKSVADLPGPSWSTTLYWLFVKGYADRGHLLQVIKNKT